MRRALIGICLVLTAGAPAAGAQPAPAGPHVEDPSKLPEPPKSVPDATYDARVLSSAASAELFQGPLDGGWTLASPQKGDLYALEVIDKRDRLEGAWRDLRRARDPDGSGVIDQIQRTPTGLEMQFAPKGQAPVRVSLKRDLQGEMEQAGIRAPVSLRRTHP